MLVAHHLLCFSLFFSQSNKRNEAWGVSSHLDIFANIRSHSKLDAEPRAEIVLILPPCIHLILNILLAAWNQINHGLLQFIASKTFSFQCLFFLRPYNRGLFSFKPRCSYHLNYIKERVLNKIICDECLKGRLSQMTYSLSYPAEYRDMEVVQVLLVFRYRLICQHHEFVVRLFVAHTALKNDIKHVIRLFQKTLSPVAPNNPQSTPWRVFIGIILSVRKYFQWNLFTVRSVGSSEGGGHSFSKEMLLL